MGDGKNVMDAWNRKWRTLWVWSQLYMGYKAAQAKSRLLKGEQREAFWERKHSYLAESIWSNIAELRGWWVKVGQFLSTRSDLLPSQYIKHLTKLQDMMPTSEFSIVSKIVEQELGSSLTSVFSEFSEKAIASASIGQVHKARLKSTGQYVVVKIQHPGVEQTLKQDMVTLTQMTWAFGLLEKGLNFGPILDEWQKSAADELDFRLELKYQQRARNAAEAAKLEVIIPKCYPEYTTKKVLVMDFIEGFKITDTQALKKHNVDVDLLMCKICDAFAHQIHVDGLFNGDPHPGNILVQIDSTSGKAIPVLLDWGLVKVFDLPAKIAFANAVYSVANMDVMGLVAAFEDMGFKFKSDSPIDPELYMDTLRLGFFRDTGETMSTIEKDAAVSAIKNSNITKKDVIEQNPIDDWPKDIIFFIRVASLLHGLSLQLSAKVPFLQILVGKAEQCLCERFIPTSPLVYIQYPAVSKGKIRSVLEWKVIRFLRHLLLEKKLLLGCQVAVFKDGQLIVDTSVGQMGPTNSQPVTSESLFCTMTAVNGILATAVLKLIDSYELSLDDPLCHWWDGFIRFNKHDIRVRDVLSHRAGMHAALPEDLKLSQLIDYDTMISIIENAPPVEPRGSQGGQYAYLTSGWLLSELIRGVTGMRVDEFIRSQFIRKFGLQNEMFFPIPKRYLRSLKQQQQQSMNNKMVMSSSSPILSSAMPDSPSIEPTVIESPFLKPGGAHDILIPGSVYDTEKTPLYLLDKNSQQEKENFLEKTHNNDHHWVPIKTDYKRHSFTTSHSNISPHNKANKNNTSSSVWLNTNVSPQKKMTRTTPLCCIINDNKSLKKSQNRYIKQPLNPSKNLWSFEMGLDEIIEQRHQQHDSASSLSTSPTIDLQLSPIMLPSTSPLHSDNNNIIINNDNENNALLLSSPLSFSTKSFSSFSSSSSSSYSSSSMYSTISRQDSINSTTTTLSTHDTLEHKKKKISISSSKKINSWIKGKKILQPLPNFPSDNIENNLTINDDDHKDRYIYNHNSMMMVVKSHHRRFSDIRKNNNEICHRLTSSRRELGSSRISNQEILEKLYQVNAGKVDENDENSINNKLALKYPSKYYHKLILEKKKKRFSAAANNNNTLLSYKRCSALQLLRLKPHVLDPLVYDSRRIHNALIPPTNMRCTARALARFYAAIASGKLIKFETLKKASVTSLIDNSLDTLILTGGSTRLWGLGYQLYPCRVKKIFQHTSKKTKQPAATLLSSNETTTGVISRRVKFNPGQYHNKKKSLPKIITGLGHGDLGGNIGFCIPEFNLSIVVLVNDILTGPIATREIVSFILNCFGLEPNWALRYPFKNGLCDINQTISSYSTTHKTPSTAALKKESKFYIVN